ncbi:DUF4097 family beta strand repeat-containing protein [Streptomyces sp. 4N509B]|uniref:DUF4097 family beta strand repeat-containing protein n=1 Tax=Streptomyces sp. 4N509B TaxID=3457413 RepID=UPI003FD286B2
MARTSEWSLCEARTLRLDEPLVEELHIRVVGGTVNVVGTADSTTLVEVAEVHGPPLVVRRSERRLTIAYEDLPWRGLLGWLGGGAQRRHAVVSVRVPAAARLSLGVVGASAVVSGLSGDTEVRGVTGDTTLVGLSGPVHADTVSGDLDAQSLTGTLTFSSVSGGLTVVDSTCPRLAGDSVRGAMVVDAAPGAGPAHIRLTTVSGEVALRLADPVDARVHAATTSGALSSGFAELTPRGPRGARRLTGRLGSGAGSVHCSTVSGSIALLRRPGLPEEEPVVASLKDV